MTDARIHSVKGHLIPVLIYLFSILAGTSGVSSCLRETKHDGPWTLATVGGMSSIVVHRSIRHALFYCIDVLWRLLCRRWRWCPRILSRADVRSDRGEAGATMDP